MLLLGEWIYGSRIEIVPQYCGTARGETACGYETWDLNLRLKIGIAHARLLDSRIKTAEGRSVANQDPSSTASFHLNPFGKF